MTKKIEYLIFFLIFILFSSCSFDNKSRIWTGDEKELLSLFDRILKNNKFEKEVRNLIIFKKALFQSNSVSEIELLETVNPLINTETLWKPHALLLLGDYFVSKREYLKAKEFYIQILALKNLHKELYEQARSQLMLITNG